MTATPLDAEAVAVAATVPLDADVNLLVPMGLGLTRSVIAARPVLELVFDFDISTVALSKKTLSWPFTIKKVVSRLMVRFLLDLFRILKPPSPPSPQKSNTKSTSWFEKVKALLTLFPAEGAV